MLLFTIFRCAQLCTLAAVHTPASLFLHIPILWTIRKSLTKYLIRCVTASLPRLGNICGSACVCFLPKSWLEKRQLCIPVKAHRTWDPSELMHHPGSCFELSSLAVCGVFSTLEKLRWNFSTTGSHKIKAEALTAFRVMTQSRLPSF